MYQLPEIAKQVLKTGEVKIRVQRTGMFQQLTFRIKHIRSGNIEYAELFTERMIDTYEISRIAKEIGLPVEAQNGRAFPEGTTASDFQGL
jgi:hypothetical protein